MKKTEKIREAYYFFCSAEREERTFTLEELAEKTGWALSTVNVYKTKKWYQFIHEVEGGFYISKGIIEFPEASFIKIHEQRAEIYPDLYRPHFGESTDMLIDKSREAALLAVQIYNNPMVVFRTEGFIVNMIIAYTTLFQGIFEKKNIMYWYLKENGQPVEIDGENKYWELTKCLEMYYGNDFPPERKNVEIIILIRNKIVHHFYKSIDEDISGYCQSLLNNYEDLLINEFGRYFSLGNDRITLALQISSFTQENKEALTRIHQQNYEYIQNFIREFSKNLPNTITDSQKYCFRVFLLPRTANHENSSAKAIKWVAFDPDHPEDINKLEVGLIREKEVQIANLGKFLPGAVVNQIKEKGIPFSINLHTHAWKYYKVRTKEKNPHGCNTRYCQYSEPHQNYIYTQEWVDFLIKKLTNPEEYEKIKTYKE